MLDKNITLLYYSSVIVVGLCEGTLVIQFSLVNLNKSRAAEAVANLKRRLLPDSNRRSRRNVDATPQLLRSDIDNQTITATGIHSWTSALSDYNWRFSHSDRQRKRKLTERS